MYYSWCRNKFSFGGAQSQNLCLSVHIMLFRMTPWVEFVLASQILRTCPQCPPPPSSYTYVIGVRTSKCFVIWGCGRFLSYKLLFIPCSCSDHCNRNHINLFSHDCQTTSHQSLRSESPCYWGPRVNPRQQWSPCSYRSWRGGRSSWGCVPNHHCDTAGGDRISVCGMEEG